jgi:hypothetical protein
MAACIGQSNQAARLTQSNESSSQIRITAGQLALAEQSSRLVKVARRD